VRTRRLSETLRGALVECRVIALDVADALRGRRDPLVPPRRLLYDGPRDPGTFRENGREFLRHYVDRCGLRPDEHILDVGSGMGRKTVPLTGYLSSSARYLGLDVNPRGVDWCTSRITSRFPNFAFQHLDVYNGRYNPHGRLQDATVAFPCAEHSVDFVVMASVLTHMLPDGMKRYLSEAARVLRPTTGRCLVTLFVLDEVSRAGIEEGRSIFNFRHRHGSWAVEREDRPEDAVAYEERFVRPAFEDAGLAIRAVFPGSWSGRSPAISFQDLYVAHVAP
jgi:SAM-dependent methyltransferase